MSLFPSRKSKFYLAVLVLSGGFLFSLSAVKPAQALYSTSTYQKLYSEVLTAEEWNNLFRDFVNTWLPVSLNGPVGIATPAPVAGLSVNGPILATGNVGIGSTNPTAKLDVIPSSGNYALLAGSYKIGNVALPLIASDAATKGYVDSLLGAGSLPTATIGQTMRYDGASWISNSLLYNNGTNIGIGITNPSAKLEIAPASGNYALLAGSYKIGNVALPTVDADAATKGYVDSFVNSSIATATGSIAVLWGGTTGGNVWSLNSGNVGVGTATPGSKLSIYNNGPDFNIPVQIQPSANTKESALGFIPAGAVSGANTTWTIGRAYNANRFSIRTWDGTTDAERLVMNSSGNIGIGTTGPGRLFDVNGMSRFRDSLYFGAADDKGLISWGGSPEGLVVRGSTAKALYLGSNNTNQVTIDTAGNVGVGTTNPVIQLDVSSGSNFKQLALRNTYGSQVMWAGSVADTVGSFIANNAYYTSSYWFKPNYSAASGINFRSDGGTEFFNDTGLTSGTDYLPTKRMTILSNGNIGVAKASPSATLDVTGSISSSGTVNGTGLCISGDCKVSWPSIVSAGGGNLWSGTTTSAIWNGNGTNNVGIGTTAPTKKLEIQGGTATSGANNFALKLKGTYGGTDWTGILFGATHSDSYNKGGIIFRATDGSNLRGQLQFLLNDVADSATGVTANTDAKMVVDYGGNVGIGTTAPGSKFQIQGGALQINNASSNGGAVIKLLGSNTNKNWMISNQQNFAGLEITPSTAAGGSTFTTPVLLINDSGNVGIGTTTPVAKLDVVGAIRSSDSSIWTLNLGTNTVGGNIAGQIKATYSPSYGYTGKLSFNVLTNGVGTDYGPTEEMYLEVLGADTKVGKLVILPFGGNVGIGKTNPSTVLDVVGGISSTGTVNGTGLCISGDCKVSWAAVGSASAGWNRTAPYIYPATLTDNVGIGITNPAADLVIQNTGANNTQLWLQNTGTGITEIGFDAANGDFAGSDYMSLGQTDALDGYIKMFANAGRFHIDTGSAERLTILQNGNVGIGTAGPDTSLNVFGTVGSGVLSPQEDLLHVGGNELGGIGGYAGIRIGGTSDSRYYNYIRSVKTTSYGNYWNSDLAFGVTRTGTANTFDEVLRVTSGSNVGVGTTAPSATLHVQNGGGGQVFRVTNAAGSFGFGVDTLGGYAQASGGGGGMWFYNSAGSGYIGVNGAGNIGIAKTNPTTTLDIVGSLSSTGTLNGTGLCISGDCKVSWAAVGSASAGWNRTAPYVYPATLTDNVGIGITNPTRKLEISGGASYPLEVYSSQRYLIGLRNTADTGGGWWFGDEATGDFFLHENGVGDRVTVQNATGNVGVGTTNPNFKLTVSGVTGSSQYYADSTNVETVSGTYTPTKMVYAFNEGRGLGYNAADDRIFFAMNEGIPMVIDNGGTVGIGTTTPTYGKLQISGGNIVVNRPLNKVDNANVSELPAFEINNAFAAGQAGYVRVYYPTYNNLLFGADYDGNIGGAQPNIQFGRVSTPYLTIVNNGASLGNVGIAKTNPGAALDIVGSLSSTGTLNGTGLCISGDCKVSWAAIGAASSGWSQNGNEVYKTATAGNVGIGTTAPASKLSVYDSGSAQSAFEVSDTSNYRLLINTGGNDGLDFYNGASLRFNADAGGLNMWSGYALTGINDYLVLKDHSSRSYGIDIQTYDGASYTSKLRVMNSGNVGMGITAPTAPLHIVDTGGATTTPNTALILDYESDTTSMAGGGTAIEFRGKSSGGNLANYQQARIRSVSYDSNNSHGIAFDYKPNAATALTEAMRINNGGLVGIGLTNPGYTLDVNGTLNVAGANPIRMNGWWFANYDSTTGGANGTFKFGPSQDIDANFVNGGASRLYIDASTGNVGIAKTNPGATLDVVGSINSTGTVNGTGLCIGGDCKASWAAVGAGSSGWSQNVNEVYKTNTAGNVGVGTTAPGAKLNLIGPNAAPNIGNESLRIEGTGTSDWLNFGVDGTNRVGWIRAVRNGTGENSLSLQPFGGNVGIGTTTPAYKLDVVGSINSGALGTNGSIYLNSAGDGLGGASLTYSNTNNTLTIGQNRGLASRFLMSSTAGIEFQTEDSTSPYNKVTRMIVRHGDAGNVGIGTTLPDQTLHVASAGTREGYSASAVFSDTADKTKGVFVGFNSTSDYGLIAASDLGTSWKNVIIQPVGGNVGIGITNPTARLEIKGVGGTTGKTFRLTDNPGNEIFSVQDGGAVAVNYGPFSVGTSMLYVNYASTNVGISKTNPATTLDIVGSLSSTGTLNGTGLCISGDCKVSWAAIGSASAGWNRTAPYVYPATLTDNVGIGITNPQAPLNTYAAPTAGFVEQIRVGGTSNYPSLTMGTYGSYGGYIATYGNEMYLYAGNWRTVGNTATEDHRIYFHTSKAGSTNWSTPKMTLNQDGNLGIGTTAPTKTLHVVGDVRGGTYYNTNSGDGWLLNQDSGTNRGLYYYNTAGTWDFFEGGSSKVTISNTGNLQIDGKLSVDGSSNSYIMGNVGIGTTAPKTILHTGKFTGGSGGIDEVMRVTGDYTALGSGALLRFTNQHDSGTNPNAGEYNLGGIAGVDDTNSWGASLAFYTAPSTANGGNLTERMRIKSDGNVGIAKTNPGTVLDVVGGVNSTGTLNGTGLCISGDCKVSWAAVGAASSGWSQNGNEVYKTNTAGNVGIGTTAPTQKLHVGGSGVNIQIGDTGGGALYFNNTSNNISYNANQFQFNTTQPAGFTFNGGNVGIGTTAPAYKLDIQGSAWNNIARIYSTGSSSGLEFYDTNGTRRGVAYSDSSGFGLLNSATSWAVRIPYGTGNVAIENGNLGVGVSNPTQKLDVVGNIELGAAVGTTRYIVTDETNTGTGKITMQAGAGSAAFGGGINLYAQTHATNPGWVQVGIGSGAGSGATEGRFSVNNQGLGGGTDIFTVLRSGNVGIAKTNPGTVLDVVGGVNASGTLNGTGLCISGDCKVSWAAVGAASSGWTQNGNEVYKTSTSGNVGIGVTNPANTLQVGSVGATGYGGNEFVVGDGTNVFALDVSAGRTNFYTNGNYTFVPSGGNGNVGIGITNPSATLHVNGPTRANNRIDYYSATTPGTTLAGQIGSNDDIGLTGGGTANSLAVKVQGTFALSTNNSATPSLLVNTSNNVGIGTTNPIAKLDVSGYVKSKTGYLDKNMLDTTVWNIATGSIGGFGANGSAAENERAWDADPFGRPATIWRSVNDAASDGDGGWDYGNIPVDPNKAYRSSVWIKKDNTGSGSVYLGCSGSNTLNLNGTANTNPYFFSFGSSNLISGRWYLLVGYIHANNDASTGSYSAVYDGVTGKKVLTGTDFKNSTGNTQVHRTYNYYDVNVGSVQTFWGPRFEEIDGNEPTIEALLGSYQASTRDGVAYFGGNVGIAKTNPGTNFDVVGGISASGTVNGTGLCIGGDCKASWAAIGSASAGWNRTAPYIYPATLTDNVGIGVTNPSAKLEIASGSTYAINITGAGLNQGAPAGNYDHIITPRVRIGYMNGTNIGTIASNAADSGLSFITHSAGTGWVENLRIQPNGNVGIGITAPVAKLHLETSGGITLPALDGSIRAIVEDATQASILVAAANNSNILFGDAGSSVIGRITYDHTNDSMQLWGAGAERLRIDSAGKIGIGTTAPVARLDARYTSYNMANYPLFVGNTAYSYAHVNYDTAVIQQDDVTTLRMVEYNNGGTNQELGFEVGDGYSNITSSVPLRFYGGANPGATIYSGAAGTLAMAINVGNVGIGKTNPGTTLDVVGGVNSSGTVNGTGLCISGDCKVSWAAIGAAGSGWSQNGTTLYKTDTAGNVGIGTTAPGEKLDVRGNILSKAAASGNTWGVYLRSHADSLVGKFEIAGSETSHNGTLGLVSNNSLDIVTGNVSRIHINETSPGNGNVGIGVANPQALLHVAGEMVVNSGNWYTGRNAGGTNQPLVRSRGAGYQQTSYPGIQLGQTGDHIAMFIDPVSVVGGSFNGNLNEIFLPNNVRFLQADSAGTNWLYSGGGTLVLDNGNVGVAKSNPATNLDVVGGINSTGTVNGTGLCISGDCKASWAAVGSASAGWNRTAPYVYPATLTDNVGIGVTNPGNRLDVYNDSATYNPTSYNVAGMTLRTAAAAGDFSGIRFTAAGARESFFGVVEGAASNKSNFVFQGYDGTSLSYKEFMRINDTGNVGIGTTNPLAKLNLVGETAFTYPTMGTGAGVIHLNAPTVNDNTAAITFGGVGTTNLGQAGIYVQSSGSYGTRMHFGTTGSYATGASARMTIDWTGNVGIAKTNPGATLDIVGGLNASGTVNGTGLCIGGDCKTSWSALGAASSGWTQNGNEVYKTNTAGNVGIGTTNPTAKLNVEGMARITNGHLDVNTDNYGVYFGNGDALIREQAYNLKFENYNGSAMIENMRITGTGNVGISITNPSQKLEVSGNIKKNSKVWGSKSVQVTTSWTTVLTLSLPTSHTSANVSLNYGGSDWCGHSAAPNYQAKYIVRNGAGGYGDPGSIISEFNDMGTQNDYFQSQIVNAGSGVFNIQIKINDGGDGFPCGSAPALPLEYDVDGNYASVS